MKTKHKMNVDDETHVHSAQVKTACGCSKYRAFQANTERFKQKEREPLILQSTAFYQEVF